MQSNCFSYQPDSGFMGQISRILEIASYKKGIFSVVLLWLLDPLSFWKIAIVAKFAHPLEKVKLDILS